MDEMIKYIFNTVQKTEENMEAIIKAFKRQKRLNSKLTVLSTACITYIALLESQRKDEKAVMKELRGEVDNLRKKAIAQNIRLEALETVKGEVKM